MTRHRLLAIGLWIWVLGVLGAYLFQFRGLAGPILAALGLR